MGYVERRASMKAKGSIQGFDAAKTHFLLDIQAVVVMEEIPHDLVINWDQTGIHMFQWDLG